jgi:phosphoglycerol transferase
MRGRESDWQQTVVRSTPRDLLGAVSAIGFDGLWIDRFGYVDRGAGLEAQVSALLGASPVVSRDGRFSFYSLDTFGREQAKRLGPEALTGLRESTLAAPTLRLGAGVAEASFGLGAPGLVLQAEAQVTLVNRTDHSQNVVISGAFASAAGGGGILTVRIKDQIARIEVPAQPADRSISVLLRPGEHDLALAFTSHNGAPQAWRTDALRVKV